MLAYPRTDQLFAGGMPPAAWFYAFEQDRSAAVQDLLLGAADLGPFQVLDPWAVAIQWLQPLSDTGFPADFDAALTEWIAASWGKPIHPASCGSAVLTARAWESAGLIIANFDRLPISAGILRDRVLGDREFLAFMGEGPARDPAGRAWQALAQYQEDDSLFEEWQQILALDPGVSWYHGQYGLMGVDLLPSNRGGTGIPAPLAYGLRRFGNALLRLVTDGCLNEGSARREFERLSRWAQKRYPFKGAWRSVWRQLIEHENDRLAPWVTASLGVESVGLGARFVEDRWQLPRATPDWFGRVRQIRLQLKRPTRAIWHAANALMSEMEAYYHATSDSYDFVRAACNLATALPDRWHESWIPWLEKAARFDPADPYPLHQLTQSFLRTRDLRKAEQVARWAVYYFPLDVVGHNQLGKVLKVAGRLEEAEQVHRETVQHFPDNVIARNALGEVLKAADRFEEAEEVYRETVQRFSNDVFARTGLGEVLKAEGGLEEAEQVYRETVQHFPDNVFARCGLGDVLKTEGRLEEAERVYRETMRRFPNDVVPRHGLGDVLKAEGRFKEVEKVYQETMRRFPNDVVARYGLGDVLKAEGRFEEAETVYREALSLSPKDRYATAGLKSIDIRRRASEQDLPDFDTELIPDLDDAASLPSAGTLARDTSGEDESPRQSEAQAAEGEVLAVSNNLEVASEQRGLADSDQHTSSTVPPGGDVAPQHPAHTMPSLFRASDVDILIQDSHLLRKWARGTSEEAISQIREEARSLLNKLEKFVGSSPAAVMESSFLLIETQDIRAALRLLNEAAARYPASKRVQYALARTRREEARQAWQERHPFPFNSPDVEGIQRAWAQLLQLEPVLLPSARLGLVRSLPYLTDGDQLKKAHRNGLGKLAHALRSLQPDNDTRNPRSYWAYRVGELVLGDRAAEIRGASEVSDDDIDLVSKNCEQNLLTLNGLEEDLLLHYHVS